MNTPCFFLRSSILVSGLRVGVVVPVVLFFLFICGCNSATEEPVIARVGDKTLTLNALLTRIPPDGNEPVSREQYINYVKKWIDNELLYQEALHQHLQHEPDMRRRIEEMQRDLLCAEMITRNATPVKNIRITEQMISDYYQAHKESFLRHEDVYRYLEIRLPSLKKAWQVRNQVTHNNFLHLAMTYSTEKITDPRSVPFIPASHIPSTVLEKISDLRVRGTSGPIPFAEEYLLIHMLDKQPKGTVCSQSEVTEEIINLLSISFQQREISALLAELRQNTEVEFNFHSIPDHIVELN